ncbi:hypothetical protein SAMN05216167_105387 [Spirosoma endophyticum]|uniref:Uncharacterized protein n=1 Tax=Spirosoma endophyticum TaxID=662367 RepID=A0A1I1T8V5_9BACT|nr:hypothetical protein SAMN05216167_105387 [Spirosoma endophyticum]
MPCYQEKDLPALGRSHEENKSKDTIKLDDNQAIKKRYRKNGCRVCQSVAKHDDRNKRTKKRHLVNNQMPFLTTLLTLQKLSVKFFSCL